MANDIQIRKATRLKAKLRLGIAAPAGSGKTYSSLQMAFGIGKKVGMIDTEHGSGDLYADNKEFDPYDIITLSPPYSPARYVEAIRAFERAGYDVIIVDSLSHAWSGEGGSLDRQGKIADKSGNSWQAWRQVTPEHASLVEALLQSPCHIIATMRAKTEYVQEKDDRTGKNVVKKLGMAPVMRDGIEYEFTTFLEMTQDHFAFATKDRTGLFDGNFFKPGRDTGAKLLNWLDAGTERKPKPDDGYDPIKGGDIDRADELEFAITSSTDVKSLHAAWNDAYRYAQQQGSDELLTRFTTAKEAKKAELGVVQPAPVAADQSEEYTPE